MKLFGRDSAGDGARSQARVDAIVAAARAQASAPEKRPLFREPPQTPLATSTNTLDCRLSEELAYVRRSFDAIGDRLCNDPVMLTRYQVLLQNFDMLGQTLGHIATVISAADRKEAVARIGMVELRARLQRGDVNTTGPVFHRPDVNPFSDR